MPRDCCRLSFLLLGLALVASLLPADSVPITWVGPSTGNWSTASGWSPAVVPNNSNGTTYAVSINDSAVFPPTVPRVGVDISPTVDSLSLTDSFVTVQSGSTLSVNGAVPIVRGPLSGAALSVDPGATLNAGNITVLGGSTSLGISGTANIGSLTLPIRGTGNLRVNSGGLLNVGGYDGGGIAGVVGTFNIANPNVNILDLGILGTVTVGTGNLQALNSPDTLVNAGSITSNGQGIYVGGPPNLGNGPIYSLQVLPNGIYDEVISGPTSFGTLAARNSFPTSLDGTLEITLANSYIPPVGQTFLIIDSDGGGITGTFSNIERQTFNNGTEMWDIEYTRFGTEPTVVELVAVATPEPSLFVLAGLGLLGIVWARQGRIAAN